MESKNILIGISGGIAAYKICSLVSSLTKDGHTVKVVMTEHAKEFVSPLTLAALSHQPVYTTEFDHTMDDRIPHIYLAGWADVFLLAPADANTIAKAVHGIADDLLTSVIPALTCPKFMAPAMNVHMYENPVTQNNLKLAAQYGWQVIDPDAGYLACQETGKGRLPEPEHLKEILLDSFEKPEKTCAQTNAAAVLADEEGALIKPLQGMHVLISAGPTQEKLDPVRFITNYSTGKQGYAIAEDALAWGAQVRLVSGPVSLTAPEGIEVIPVKTALDMEKAMQENAAWADFIIMSAAVADYRPKSAAPSKIKKGDASMLVEFVKNPDILQELGQKKRHNQVLCGFAMETEDLDANARAKLEKKNCDMLIANNLTTPGAGFSGDTNVVSLLKPDTTEHLPMQSKSELGYTILAQCLEIWKGKQKHASVH